jgi:hypothetical protein
MARCEVISSVGHPRDYPRARRTSLVPGRRIRTLTLMEPGQRFRASFTPEKKALTCRYGGALGGTRTPNLLIRRLCRPRSRPGYIPRGLVGRHSLMRVISLSCAVLYGQMQASADQDHRLTPRYELPARATTGRPRQLAVAVCCRACQRLCVPVAVHPAVRS